MNLRDARRLGAVLLIGAAAAAWAAPFEPLFQVVQMEGGCQVRVPGGPRSANAELNKAYPFGTSIVSDSKGKTVLRLSEGNTVQMQPGTSMTVGEGAKDPSRKHIALDVGGVQVKLDAKDQETNALQVRTPAAAADLMGGEFLVENRSEPELNVSTFKCLEGQMRVWGPSFTIPTLNKGCAVSVSAAKDDSYTYVQVLAGQVALEFRDADNALKRVEAKQGAVVKIWRRLSESGKMWIVSILITQEGELEEVITSLEEVSKAVWPPREPGETPPPTVGPKPGEGKQPPSGTPPDGTPDENEKWLGKDMLPQPKISTSTAFPTPTPVGRN